MKLNARALALACLAGAAFTAATVADAGTLTVDVSARGNQRATWQEAFDQFRKANPDIDLKVTYVAKKPTRCRFPAGSPPTHPTY